MGRCLNSRIGGVAFDGPALRSRRWSVPYGVRDKKRARQLPGSFVCTLQIDQSNFHSNEAEISRPMGLKARQKYG